MPAISFYIGSALCRQQSLGEVPVGGFCSIVKDEERVADAEIDYNLNEAYLKMKEMEIKEEDLATTHNKNGRRCQLANNDQHGNSSI